MNCAPFTELRTIHRRYAGALARSRQDNRDSSTELARHARTPARRFEEH
ncbi:MAG TPA: hypothetical protein VFG33_35655 [Kribbella sp.]|nr:hypothetical protein [Kribbella sp.]HET6298761.1 hypothetical protein [Kribbella sp.]